MAWFSWTWTWWEWVLLLLVLAAIAVAIAVPIVFNNNSSRRRNCPCKPTWAQASQNGTLVLSAAATGPTGAATTETGFLNVLSTTITTCRDSNAIVATVSAQSAIGTIDAQLNADDISNQQVSVEVAQIAMQVVVDGVVLAPAIVFDGLAHILDNTVDPGHMRAYLELQASSNSYQWVATGLAPGAHTVTVQAQLQASVVADLALFAQSTASLSNAIVTVQPAAF
jgi:hypothetical protein